MVFGKLQPAQHLTQFPSHLIEESNLLPQVQLFRADERALVLTSLKPCAHTCVFPARTAGLLLRSGGGFRSVFPHATWKEEGNRDPHKTDKNHFTNQREGLRQMAKEAILDTSAP
jgi:hypothetical protein